MPTIPASHLTEDALDYAVALALATAPAGFAHLGSTMIGTLLDDIAAGMPFEQVSRRFAAKMHPLRYQRPQAAPKAGNIAAAEKLVEDLGLAPALRRRMARVQELSMTWEPKTGAAANLGARAGVFGHLEPRAKPQEPQLSLPPITMTLQKFVGTVVESAERIQVNLVKLRERLIFITTASDPDAPRLFQWDHPFAWFCYNGGAPVHEVSLATGWNEVRGITRLPARLGDTEGRFKHHGDGLVLLLGGARALSKSNLCLFPEFLRSELHGARATIEAHSKSTYLDISGEDHAIGYDMRDSGCAARLRVLSGGVWQEYQIDRWD